jgi:hypothetical protein
MSDPQQQPSASATPTPAASAAYGASPGYPGSAAAAPSGDRAGLARAALAFAVVSVVLSLVSSLLTRFLLVQMVYRLHLPGSAITAYNLITQAILLLAFGAALILGLMAAGGQRKLLAGIAIGVGGAGAISTLVSLLATMLAPMLF